MIFDKRAEKMNVDLKKIGQDFKVKREEMHLSLKEVENATSIRKPYLEAIEDGRIDKFLSSVYAIGFVKQYASFLGMNGEKIIKDNPSAFIIPQFNRQFDYGIGTLEKRTSHGRGVKWLPNIFWIGVSLIGIIFLWALVKYF
jgi:cytoskeletal protein RodZ